MGSLNEDIRGLSALGIWSWNGSQTHESCRLDMTLSEWSGERNLTASRAHDVHIKGQNVGHKEQRTNIFLGCCHIKSASRERVSISMTQV